MKWRYCLEIVLMVVLLLCGCEKSLTEKEHEEEYLKNPNELTLRFRSAAGVLANVNLYAFRVMAPGDTVCYSVLPQVSAAALANPVKLTLPMGEYVLVVLGNQSAGKTQPWQLYAHGLQVERCRRSFA